MPNRYALTLPILGDFEGFMGVTLANNVRPHWRGASELRDSNKTRSPSPVKHAIWSMIHSDSLLIDSNVTR